MVKVKDVNGTTYLDQGWARFSIAHNEKIGYFKVSGVTSSMSPYLTTT
jgi:hypothetical protein